MVSIKRGEIVHFHLPVVKSSPLRGEVRERVKYKYYFETINMDYLVTKKTFTLALIALTIIFFFPLLSHAEPVAEITGAPFGFTNQTNPVISVGGNDVVSYRYKLDGSDYSEEIPVDTPINFSAIATILGQEFVVGPISLQNFLDKGTDYIDSVTFANVSVDTPVVFLLNQKRMTLKTDNILYIEGSNIDQLNVYMNNSPTTPAVVVNQSLSGGNGYITYDLTTDTPETDYIRIINRGADTSSFKINLNNKLFSTDADVLTEIQTMQEEYPGEPIERKVWRFIRDNRYHWYPIAGTESPALFFNSIGFGFCDNVADIYCQLMTSLGYQARIWFFSAHTVPEVYINGRWEMYDPDLQVYYYNYQGEVAGVEELAAHPDLITNPIEPLPCAVSWAYLQWVADIYSTSSNPFFYNLYPYVYELFHSNPNYLLNVQIPSSGIFEFPALFAAPLHTPYRDAPNYTNARLSIPRDWAGILKTPFVIHSIGYDGPHTLSVVARDSFGNWQTEPTVANWTTDSWPPITTPYQYDSADPVTLTVNEPATVYYTLDGNAPTLSSPFYDAPIDMLSSPVLKFFAIDLAGNHENVKCYSPATGDVYGGDITLTLSMDKASPQVQGTVITISAEATGSCGLYEYYFIYRNPKTGRWGVGQAYSSNPTWVWNTTGFDTGTYIIQVWTRSAGSTASYEAYKEISYTINPSLTIISTSTLSGGIQELAYNQTLIATGGNPPYTWTVLSGSLPSGLTLNGVTGEISGTPMAVGSFTFTIRVKDGYAFYVDQQFTLLIFPQECSSPFVKISQTPDAAYGTLTAAYGDAVTNDIIYALAINFSENLELDRDISITLKGGFNCNYDSNLQGTFITGTLNINNGTLTVENLIIQ